MIWKKTKDSSGPSSDPSPALAPWEFLVREILEYYCATRHQLAQLEKWDYRPTFAAVLKLSLPAELQPGLLRLRDAFQDARRKEVSEGKRHLGDLRGMLWSSIDQICTVVEAGEKQARSLSQARASLQKALAQNDLASAKVSMREVMNALMEFDRGRQVTIDRLQRSFKSQLEQLQSELQMAQKELQLDGLTQIYNRATFDSQIKKVSQLCYLSAQKACLIMFDLDHFKKVNDTYGHPAGDAVIQSFAKTIVQAFPRRSDFVARYGGEEFVVILQGTELSEARELVAKLLVKLHSLGVEHGKQKINYTASAGLAPYQSGETTEAWLSRADKALYNAKQEGRDRFTIVEGTLPKAS